MTGGSKKHKSQLTEDEKAKATEWLDNFTKGPCTACGNDFVTLGDHFVQLLTVDRENSISIGAPIYVQVMTICPHCGNTQLFNALRMGIREPTPDGKVPSTP